MKSDFLWGIDLGGTKMEGIVTTSIDDPNPLTRKRLKTPADKGYKPILLQIKKLLDLMSAKTGAFPSVLGICTPGIIDGASKNMKNCNIRVLNGRPFVKDLEDLLKIDVVIENDANCFTLAETHLGVLKRMEIKPKVVFGVIIGTGVGGGILIDGEIWNGNSGIAGEWGHNFLDNSGGPCYCGKTGCVETVISGPALERFFTQLTSQNVPLYEIIKLYSKTKNEDARLTIERLTKYFGLSLSNIVNILDPSVIIVGGGVGNIESLYGKGRETLSNYVFNNKTEVQVLKPLLGDSAGVFGAAMLGRKNS